jgi:hypothetical protein
MGLSSSKSAEGGTLKGAYAPPLPGIVLPDRLDPEVKTYKIVVPEDKGAGDKMTVAIKGREITVTIPKNYVSGDGGQSRKIQPGDKFSFQWGDRDRVIASTLPSLPGAIIVEAKPILWASVSFAFRKLKFNDRE